MKKLNTVKTILGYGYSLIERILPFAASGSGLASIYNYLPINKSLATSGQPSEAQFQTIYENGFRFVINLAPHGMENSLADEAACLQEIGLEYAHIPVNFNKPTEEDFSRFCHYLNEHQGEKVWVHCAANMRVSSFVFRYRVEVLGENRDVAQRDLDKIWQPMGVWQQFVGRVDGQADVREAG